MAKMQEAAHGGDEFKRVVHLFARRDGQKIVLFRPGMQLVHGGDQKQPVSDIEITQPAGTILYVWFQMKDGIAMFGMAATRDLHQSLHQRLGFTHHQFWDDPVMQTRKQFVITGQKAAVEKRDGELDVVGIETITFGKHAAGWAQLQAKVP